MGLIDDIRTQYNCIADVYDTLFVDKDSTEENYAVADMLAPFQGSMFEIGCGTGLLLDLVSVSPCFYKGCDPSEKMLERFKVNHQRYSDRVELGTFEQSEDWVNYHSVVSIFGSISYVRQDFLHLLAEHKCKKFLMFYKPDYTPVTYQKTNVQFFHYKYTQEQLARIFDNCNVKEFNNFLIVSSI